MKKATATSYPISIFIAGSAVEGRTICREFCDQESRFVTVTPTDYVYTGGEEAGMIVGLINYPRFPSELSELLAIAERLAFRLLFGLSQQSFSIQTPNETYWFSIREVDRPVKHT